MIRVLEFSFSDSYVLSFAGWEEIMDNRNIQEAYSKIVYFYKNFYIGKLKEKNNCELTVDIEFVVKEGEMGFNCSFNLNTVYEHNELFEQLYNESVDTISAEIGDILRRDHKNSISWGEFKNE